MKLEEEESVIVSIRATAEVGHCDEEEEASGLNCE